MRLVGMTMSAIALNAYEEGDDMRTLLQYKNDLAIAAWSKRLALTGGKDLIDLRNAGQHAYWESIGRRRWKMNAFMIHVKRHLEMVAIKQRERLKASTKQRKDDRVQQRLF